ncbi:YchJ family protein [Sedimenticola hydrogenitrophicus]|uniref:YchJ family protein n=1 Tax=Sedimenticola hydrogenitrophicus TaxID=2967975 RepID=UPI0023B0F772|nr:YchJ family protein [Sedimenticola hydrogenitrophicus]
MSLCLCGSSKPADDCCNPVLNGDRQAVTAEDLMRARYCAFASGRVDFLSSSLHPEHRDDHDVEATRRWAENSTWLGLRIVASERGGEQDADGVVEFIATFKEKGVVRHHHERSNFSRVDGEWFFVDGEPVLPETRVNQSPKIGRNDPCPCGSGKKFKKCCG